MQQPAMSTIRWLRIPGDTIFAIGAVILGWFVLGLRTGWSLERRGSVAPRSPEVTAPGREPTAERA
jgi:nitric oxide reductase subunit B